MDRRKFLKASALLGGSAILAERLQWAIDLINKAESGSLSAAELYELSKAENILYTVCLQCNTGCGIKAKILNGTVVKIDGNPLSPWTTHPHLPYKTSPIDIAGMDAPLCPKGQSGIQTLYDPYRIIKVLKRAGKRGEGKWITIPFDKAIEEIVNGGNLFSKVPGEEKRMVTGLKDIYAVKDPKLAKALSDDAKAVQAKKMTVAEFKNKHKDYLGMLIDPEHPDLGPKNNQLVFAWGRLKAGRSDLIGRFTRDAFGSTNAHGHTTVCQGSLYFTGKAMSEQYIDGKWTGGKKFYWQADLLHSEFVIFVGASPFEANYGPTHRSGRLTEGITSGRLKYVVVDPRFSKTASKAWKWIPIKPGTEAAMGMAMIRWVIDNKKHDEKFLANANKAAASADKESTWANAVWLVKIEKDGTAGAFLRAKEVGLEKEKDLFVAMKDGKPVSFDSYDTKNPVEGDLFVDTEIQGIKVKSGLQILKEAASAKSIEEWAKICDVKVDDIVAISQEFTSHGKKAAADLHRGASQHTNGFYNVFTWYSLNLLIGNYDWKGGMMQLSTYDQSGGKEGQPFPMGKLHPNKISPFGISIIRHDEKYEDTTLFKGYPAKRQWYPLASDIYQEIVTSSGDAYPYPIKALILYMGSPAYALPAGNTNIEILANTEKIPLFIVNDIVIGETSMYADYIFPDLSYLERWEFHGSHPSIAPKVQPVRQPVVAPIPEIVKVYGQEMPVSLESMLLGLSEKLGLPGFGKNGFGDGKDFLHQDDFYLKEVANIAFGEKADGSGTVPDASDDEVKLFINSRKHLPKTVFDPERWKKIVGEKLWKKVVFVLNRGGRFDDFENAYEGDKIKNRYGTSINLYQEKTAKTKSAITGKNYSGIASYLPAPMDSTGKLINDEAQGYNLNLITFREIFHTKSRTVSNYWLLALLPENSILINKVDADKLGLKDGDKAKIISASNPEGVWDLRNGKKIPIAGKIKAIQGIRPGVVGFSLGHGHWAYGSVDINIDGKIVKGDSRRSAGFHGNAAMRVDPYVKNTCLTDQVGASAVFYDTRVKLVKA